MVFSQTSQKPHSVLKVVELDRLTCGMAPAGAGGGSCAPAALAAAPPPPAAPASPSTPSTSFSEVYLKLEPEFEDSTMYHRSADCEFFQDLDFWCSAPAKEEIVQTIDPIKTTDDVNVTNTDTLSTLYHPEWDSFEAHSPTTAPASFYCAPAAPAAPAADSKAHFQEFLDISSLPVVIGSLAEPWHTHTHTHTPFIDQDDSLDAKLVAVGPQEVEWGGALSEYIVDAPPPRPLRLDVRPPAPPGPPGGPPGAPSWPAVAISTPEVLSYVEQLEKQEPLVPVNLFGQWPQEEPTYHSLQSSLPPSSPPSAPASPPAPRAAPRRRRRSDSSDDTYTPYEEHKPRKYKRRKQSLPIKDMIQALEEAQPQTKARRGRPPKRRDSAASSACSEAPGSGGGGGGKYREIRDKNNEASKRSRMNRKLKELQTEQHALELEERNKELQVRADVLEAMTRRLKDALMSAILKP